MATVQLMPAESKFFKHACMRTLDKWSELQAYEKNHLSANIQYAASVVFGAAIDPSLKSVAHQNELYVQLQGSTNLCGLCTVNNLYQQAKPTQPIQPTRSSIGDYTIDVIDLAVKFNGDNLLNINPVIETSCRKMEVESVSCQMHSF